MKKLSFILVMLVGSVAFAQTPYVPDFCQVHRDDGLALDAVALNGSASTRTFTVGPKACRRPASSWRWMVVEVDFTYTTTGNVVFTCTTGKTPSTATKTPQVCAGAGTCVALDGGIVSKAVTTDIDYAFRLGVRGYRAWSCVVSHDNTPAAGDIVTAKVYLTD